MKAPFCSSCTNHNEFFCGLKSNDRDVFSVNKKFHFYKKGEVIFAEGKRARGLFCIYKGKAKLSKTGAEGKDVIIRLINKGEVLGYRALLADEVYRASATALEDSYICKISKKVFFDQLSSNQLISANIIKILTHDLAKAEDNVIHHSQASVRQRLARVLLLLKSKYGLEKDGRTLTVTLTRREISEMTGTTTESVIRALAAFDKDGILNLHKKKIELVDLSKLEMLADLQE
ncbi:MAG TPA: Crp/Fnr family transcriptional regulator [Fulvivirga sp.]|nr:Crp/Fnr family transcriptional regulator [Fulvivirga sp.]